MIVATRYHDFSAGHRVAGHENKCASMHGHNYRIHFTVAAARAMELDSLGRILDFAGIKVLCDWLESNWDHRFLYWEHDCWMRQVADAAIKIQVEPSPHGLSSDARRDAHRFSTSFVELSFNPTAENMAIYLGAVIAPKLLPSDVRCIKVVVEETRKCSATWDWR